MDKERPFLDSIVRAHIGAIRVQAINKLRPAGFLREVLSQPETREYEV